MKLLALDLPPLNGTRRRQAGLILSRRAATR